MFNNALAAKRGEASTGKLKRLQERLRIVNGVLLFQERIVVSGAARSGRQPCAPGSAYEML